MKKKKHRCLICFFYYIGLLFVLEKLCKGLWVISLFVPLTDDNVTSLVECSLFMTFFTNHNVLVYPFKNTTQNAYFEIAN